MVSREQAVAKIKDQLEEGVDLKQSKHGPWHYGVVELRELIDYIYESEPTSKSEEINRG